MTDRQMDRRAGKNNMSPDPEGGDIIPCSVELSIKCFS